MNELNPCKGLGVGWAASQKRGHGHPEQCVGGNRETGETPGVLKINVLCLLGPEQDFYRSQQKGS